MYCTGTSLHVQACQPACASLPASLCFNCILPAPPVPGGAGRASPHPGALTVVTGVGTRPHQAAAGSRRLVHVSGLPGRPGSQGLRQAPRTAATSLGNSPRRTSPPPGKQQDHCAEWPAGHFLPAAALHWPGKATLKVPAGCPVASPPARGSRLASGSLTRCVTRLVPPGSPGSAPARGWPRRHGPRPSTGGQPLASRSSHSRSARVASTSLRL